MKVILTEDVMGVGDIGDAVQVKPGYARNFLIPRGFAVETGAASAREIEHKMRQIEAKKRKLKGNADELAAIVGGMTVNFTLRVGSGGKVFGSIGTRDIAGKLSEHEALDIDRRRVLLSEPIKKIGEHKVLVKLHPEVRAELTVLVESAKASKAEEAKETEEAKEAIEEAAESLEEEIEAALGSQDDDLEESA